MKFIFHSTSSKCFNFRRLLTWKIFEVWYPKLHSNVANKFHSKRRWPLFDCVSKFRWHSRELVREIDLWHRTCNSSAHLLGQNLSFYDLCFTFFRNIHLLPRGLHSTHVFINKRNVNGICGYGINSQNWLITFVSSFSLFVTFLSFFFFTKFQ